MLFDLPVAIVIDLLAKITVWQTKPNAALVQAICAVFFKMRKKRLLLVVVLALLLAYPCWVLLVSADVGMPPIEISFVDTHVDQPGE